MELFSNLAGVAKLLVLNKDELTEMIRQELLRNPVTEEDAGIVQQVEVSHPKSTWRP